MSTTITLEEAEANFRGLVENLQPGQEVVITENLQPIAKLICERAVIAKTAVPDNCKGRSDAELVQQLWAFVVRDPRFKNLGLRGGVRELYRAATGSLPDDDLVKRVVRAFWLAWTNITPSQAELASEVALPIIRWKVNCLRGRRMRFERLKTAETRN